MTISVATSGFGREASSKNSVVLRSGLRKRYIQDTLVRINGETSVASDANWMAMSENIGSPYAKSRSAKNDQGNDDRKIKWELPDGAEEFVVEKRQIRKKCSNKSRRRRIRRLTDQEKQQLYEHRPDLKPEKGSNHADVDLDVRHRDNAIASFTDAVTKHAVMFSPRALGSFLGNAITHIQDYAYGSSDDDEDESSESENSCSDSDSERSESSYSDQSEDDAKHPKISQKKSTKKSLNGAMNQSVAHLKTSQSHLLTEFSPSSKLLSSNPLFFDSRLSPGTDPSGMNIERMNHRWRYESRSVDAAYVDVAERTETTVRLKELSFDHINVDCMYDDFSQLQQSCTKTVNDIDRPPKRKQRERLPKKHRRKLNTQRSSIREMVTKLVSERESLKTTLETGIEFSDFHRESAHVLLDLVASETFVDLATAGTLCISNEITSVFNDSSGKLSRGSKRRDGRQIFSLTEYIKASMESRDLSNFTQNVDEPEISNAEILDSLEKALDQCPSSISKPLTPRGNKREAYTSTSKVANSHTPDATSLSTTGGYFMEIDTTASSNLSPIDNTMTHSLQSQFETSPTVSHRIPVSHLESPACSLDLLVSGYEKLSLSSVETSFEFNRHSEIESINDNDENHEKSLHGHPPTGMEEPVPSSEQRQPLEVRRVRVTNDLKKKFVFSSFYDSSNS